MYRKVSKQMLEFVQKNPTAFHTAHSVMDRLREQGYEQLREDQVWQLKLQQGYFVCRGDSSVIAFHTGKDQALPFHIIASHTDSPSFKIKEKAELQTKNLYTRLNTEGYGGMITSTWLDRPLSIAGRVLVNDGGRIRTQLLDFERDMVLIPNAAIHMNRKLNDGFVYNKQVDLLPLFSEGEASLKELVAEELSVKTEDILGSDLFLYCREHPSVWGRNEEFISSGRLDDQQCLYASMEAFLQTKNSDAVNVLACFDHEEVGSDSGHGAGSTFLQDVLSRIALGLGGNRESYLRSVASSFMLSADNAHAVHPNHPEFTDDGNCTRLNGGVVLKSHAGQKYTTDGLSLAVVRMIAQRAEVPLQFFANRSDRVGGSTLGNIALTHVSLHSADIGLPQLAMHSSYETAGVKDTFYMIELMKQFYRSNIEFREDGSVSVD